MLDFSCSVPELVMHYAKLGKTGGEAWGCGRHSIITKNGRVVVLPIVGMKVFSRKEMKIRKVVHRIIWSPMRWLNELVTHEGVGLLVNAERN